MKRSSAFFIFFAFLLFLGCQSAKEGESSEPSKSDQTKILPSSTGARCEVVLVCTEKVWNSRALNPLKNELLRPQPGLPQPESYFSIMRVDPENFKNVIQRNKAIIIVEESDTARFRWVRNLYARPQNVALITYTTFQDIYNLTARHRREIFEKFRAQDLESTRLTLLKSGAKWQDATKNQKLKILMPPGYSRVVHKDNFSMYFAQSAKTHHVIMVHTRPWDPEGNMPDEWKIISIRDSLTILHTQASRPGSYTVVDTTIRPLSRTINLNGRLTTEMRGLFKSVNDFLGGPFYTLVVFDEDRKLMVFIDAFMQAVGQNKRNMLMEMEVIARSIDFE